jgi:phosphoenolpyruvate carboxykinase (GTP)
MIQRSDLPSVALRPDGTPWWEGHDDRNQPGPRLAGPSMDSESKEGRHPNSRFGSCSVASISPNSNQRVPIDAMLFGARRRRVSLVYEARSWQHGTFLGRPLIGLNRCRDINRRPATHQ